MPPTESGKLFGAMEAETASRIGLSKRRGPAYRYGVPEPEDPRTKLEQDLCIHIFTVSAAMVGVCLTVIGLLRVLIHMRKTDTMADDLLALDSVLFLVSSLLSYWSLRTRSTRRMHRLERIVDGVFLSAMLLMVGICGFITYAISIG